MQHNWTKYIKIDKHFIKELHGELISTPYVFTDHHLANILTKGLSTTAFQASVSKLGMEKNYSPALGGVWKNVICM